MEGTKGHIKECTIINRHQKEQRVETFFCDMWLIWEAPHCNIWVNVLRDYCSILDPNIDNINAQLYALMNQILNKLVENWEYVGYDLSYKESKAHMNVYLKNKRHGLKLLIDASAPRPNECVEEHWEGMKHIIAS